MHMRAKTILFLLFLFDHRGVGLECDIIRRRRVTVSAVGAVDGVAVVSAGVGQLFVS